MIESKRARDAKKKHEPVDIELNIGDYDDEEDGTPLVFSTDDEEYEYFVTSGLIQPPYWMTLC